MPFHQLVADDISAIRQSGEWAIPSEVALDVEAPGITPAGLAALRGSGLLTPDLANAARRRDRGDALSRVREPYGQNALMSRLRSECRIAAEAPPSEGG